MRLSEQVVRFRAVVVIGWCAAGVLLIPAAARVERSLDLAARVRGSESATVDSLLPVLFESPYTHYAVLVVTGGPLPTEPNGRTLLDTVLQTVRAVARVTQARSYEVESDTVFVAPAKGATFVLVGLDGTAGAPDRVIAPLRHATAALNEHLAYQFPELELRWTGQAALNADLRMASAADARTAEHRVLPLTLMLLLLAFGTVAAALPPILTGVMTITFALGAAALISEVWPLSILLQTFVSMMGLGLGIDYALLTIGRFRESLAHGRTPLAAAADTIEHAGRTIALSGTAVLIGFVALLLVPVNELRSVAIGGMLAAGFAVLLASTLLPALLTLLGRGVNWGKLRPVRDPLSGGNRWRRWGVWVTHRPMLVLVAAGLPLCLLAWQTRRIEIGLPASDDWLPPATESVQALRELEAAGRSGFLQSLRVIVQFPEGVDALGDVGWLALHRIYGALVASPEIARVQSFTDLSGDRPPSRLRFLAVSQTTRRTFLSGDRSVALLEAIPHADVDPVSLVELARKLRASDHEIVAGMRGIRVRVGGLPAFRADYQDAVGGRLLAVVPLVIGGTFIALFAAFRSVLIPLKAIALNLLSVAAGFGAVVLVFQDGVGVGFLGLSEPVGQVFAVIPTLVFCTVFGLSMDYEVFLVARIAEARRIGLPDGEAVAEGLARTGPVITSAAAIMVVVFGAFTVGDFLVIKMLGLALAVSVFVDATVVRMAIGPALLVLAGRWNWWPGRCTSVGGSAAVGRVTLVDPAEVGP